VSPNVEVILNHLSVNGFINLENEILKRKDISNKEYINNEIWNDIFENRILPFYMKNIGNRTDVLGIILTPWYRYSTTNANTTKNIEPMKSTYSCTGLITRVWAAAGIQLFPNLHYDAIYPSDFLQCKFFIHKSE